MPDRADYLPAGGPGTHPGGAVDGRVGGIGSDTFGPDASSDGDFLATFTALANNGLVLTNLAKLDSLHRNGDLIMAPTVALRGGSGYQVDPISCRRSDDADSDSDSDS